MTTARVVTAWVVLLWLAVAPAAAQTGFSVEIFSGAAFNFPTTLTLKQAGEPDLEFSASYETRPLDQPFYWALRLGLRRPGRAFELQLIHHKTYLKDPPPEVESFEVTHGFNILTVNYALERALPLTIRVGAGVVLPYVTASVRGSDFSTQGGYKIAGPAFLLGAGKSWRLVGGLTAAAETQLTAGWISTAVSGGEVSASNVALHLWLGVGYRL